MANKYLDSDGLLYFWSKIKAALPKKTSELTNDSGFITIDDVPEGVSPSTTTPKMDGTAATGTETAYARGDHVHPSDSTKVDKVSGKGLSTNDYTTAEKNKLAGIDDNANNYTLPAATSSALGGVKTGSNINNSSGTISVNDGTTSAKGVVQLTDTIGSDSTKAATPTAVKAVQDEVKTKADKSTTIAGYGITDAYTKTEVDGKLSGALHYQGTKENYSDLPTTGNVKGDVWNITNADASHGVKAGDNVAWNGTEWDVLAGTVDLSAYMLTSDMVRVTNTEIDTIVAS
jgi:hypothetical protein